MNNLGFEKDPKDTRVVVAMSGGVDSSVVAAHLKAEGYDVVGITLQLYDQSTTTQTCATPSATAAKTATKTCCAGADIYDARQVAGKIGIPHYVLDYESRFSQSVIDDFADSYLKGETPVPCIRCNQRVKFRDLLETARELNADCLATGHYAQRLMGTAGPELHAGADPARDQSYFLFATTPDQLDYLRFPLGHLPKPEVRRMAAHYGLIVAEKPDSQDICFVPNGKYADIVARLRPGAIEPGDIVDTAGNVLGRHDGIIHFTIGQRKGLNLQQREGASRDPLFVTALNAEKRQVIVGPHVALAKTSIRVNDVNWLQNKNQETPRQNNLQVRFRSSMAPVTADVERHADGGATVHFHDAQFGVAPGQACVIYDGARVLGGGWIARQEPVAAAA